MPATYSAINTGVVVTLFLLSTVISITLGGIAWSRINSLFLPFPTSLGAISTLYPLLPFLSALMANILASRYQRNQNNSPKNQITSSTTSDENGSHTTSVTAVSGIIPMSGSSRSSFFISLINPIIHFIADQSLTLLPVVIATLTATYVSPSDNNCHLEQAWQEYYHNKDVNSIRTIQDQLQCCGLRSTRDRAWPFKDANHGDNACERTTGYTQSCLQPWSEQERRVAVLVLVAAVLGWGIKLGVTNFGVSRAVNLLARDCFHTAILCLKTPSRRKKLGLRPGMTFLQEKALSLTLMLVILAPLKVGILQAPVHGEKTCDQHTRRGCW
ncbi:hypothetical protein TSTA_117470 [Talaromyces stipitatus ATCC 10500]|uniref:Tetraspanin Tsp3 n=1 Tax=Talaromyces stipitatus (strain ATCC 10500 / CBS 375.48 / QM 6759 / NRRL 1006) TaxID=441959 RepID=B8MDK3_TALSN|nr:uncharacterized protein TSTA_117470 [Talaromyces stipitatus ATCC 10500]EED17967.1 hypothetical protein TSTA_117470 [Talaromyces stipitatus ATCC 10500]